MTTAFFVKKPRRIEDLMKPHLINHERPYEVVNEIALSAIDYENFTTDMGADRQSIEDNASLCAEGDPMRCLYVCTRSKKGGVLIVPEYKKYIKWAAFVM